MDTKDKVVNWMVRNAVEKLDPERLKDGDLILFRLGDMVAATPEPELELDKFQPLAESQHIPLDPDLWEMPHQAEIKAMEIINARMEEPDFEKGLRAADWNNLGCLYLWRPPKPDRAQAIAQFEKAMKKEMGYDDLPPAARAIVKNNLDLVKTAPVVDQPGGLIRPFYTLMRELMPEEVQNLEAGQVPGLRFEIVE